MRTPGGSWKGWCFFFCAFVFVSGCRGDYTYCFQGAQKKATVISVARQRGSLEHKTSLEHCRASDPCKGRAPKPGVCSCCRRPPLVPQSSLIPEELLFHIKHQPQRGGSVPDHLLQLSPRSLVSADCLSAVLPSHIHPSPNTRGALPRTTRFIVGDEFGRALKGSLKHSRNKWPEAVTRTHPLADEEVPQEQSVQSCQPLLPPVASHSSSGIAYEVQQEAEKPQIQAGIGICQGMFPIKPTPQKIRNQLDNVFPFLFALLQ